MFISRDVWIGSHRVSPSFFIPSFHTFSQQLAIAKAQAAAAVQKREAAATKAAASSLLSARAPSLPTTVLHPAVLGPAATVVLPVDQINETDAGVAKSYRVSSSRTNTRETGSTSSRR